MQQDLRFLPARTRVAGPGRQRVGLGRRFPYGEHRTQTVQLVVELPERLRTEQRMANRLSAADARSRAGRAQRRDLPRRALLRPRARRDGVRFRSAWDLTALPRAASVNGRKVPK